MRESDWLDPRKRTENFQVEGAARDRDYIVEALKQTKHTEAWREVTVCVICKVLVPEKSGSHLIGQKGDRVKALCQAGIEGIKGWHLLFD